jgi:hypothetical protein
MMVRLTYVATGVVGAIARLKADRSVDVENIDVTYIDGRGNADVNLDLRPDLVG